MCSMSQEQFEDFSVIIYSLFCNHTQIFIAYPNTIYDGSVFLLTQI